MIYGKLKEECIKPCPFCGEKEIRIIRPTYPTERFKLECKKCRVIIKRQGIIEEAIAMWNKRAGDKQ